MHLDVVTCPPPYNVSELEITEAERETMAEVQAFRDFGMAYALEHATRTATIGLALSASPVALLA